jgi:hypothetical protein
LNLVSLSRALSHFVGEGWNELDLI